MLTLITDLFHKWQGRSTLSTHLDKEQTGGSSGPWHTMATVEPPSAEQAGPSCTRRNPKFKQAKSKSSWHEGRPHLNTRHEKIYTTWPSGRLLCFNDNYRLVPPAGVESSFSPVGCWDAVRQHEARQQVALSLLAVTAFRLPVWNEATTGRRETQRYRRTCSTHNTMLSSGETLTMFNTCTGLC